MTTTLASLPLLPPGSPMPERCVACDRPVRHARAEVKPAGTVVYAGYGLCCACRSAQRRATAQAAEAPDTATAEAQAAEEKAAWDRYGLSLYITERRRRGVPAHGYLMEGEEPDPHPTLYLDAVDLSVREASKLERELAEVRRLAAAQEARERVQAAGYAPKRRDAVSWRVAELEHLVDGGVPVVEAVNRAGWANLASAATALRRFGHPYANLLEQARRANAA